MIERPILFSAPMVKAILAGTKTQTRRVVKKYRGFTVDHLLQLFQRGKVRHGLCPYGQVGDRLWVRETFVIEGTDEYPMEESQYPRDGRPVDPGDADSYGWKVPWYRATDGEPNIVNEDDMDNERDPELTRWKPSIFMPRWASRITLEITEVRVQRLNEISREDCEAEGAPGIKEWADPYVWYHWLWDEINGKRKGCDWGSNPLVWAVSFKRIKP